MSTSQANLTQRRKSAKIKAKHVNTSNERRPTQPQLPPTPSPSSSSLASLFAERSVDWKNERFQRLGENNKLLCCSSSGGVGMNVTSPITALTTTTYTSSLTTSTAITTYTHTPMAMMAGNAAAILCNGKITAIVNCCRDVNCKLNVTPMPACPFNAPPQRDLAKENNNNSNNNNNNNNTVLSHSVQHKRSLSLQFALSTTETTDNGRQQEQQQQQQQNENEEAYQQQQQQSNENTTDLTGNCWWPTWPSASQFVFQVQLDLFSWALLLVAFCTRFYRLSTPRHVVFDELHYGKFIAHYIRNIFFFDHHPPLGKQLIAGLVSSIGYTGNFTVSHIGSRYPQNMPIFWFRFLPALCGSILPAAVYNLLLESGLTRWCSLLGGLLVIFDNALLTQSRFVLMESMLLCFSVLGLSMLLRFQKIHFPKALWVCYGVAAACFLTCAICIKYAGLLTFCLAGYLILKHFWDLLYNATITNVQICLQAGAQFIIFTVIPLCLYLFIFYIHLRTLHRAGPHDSVMTSAFQASLDGGLASITKGQPLNVAHGSQITLRHTYGQTCWLHSHAHVYPVRYSDNRGSSHQQQVTCYSFKDVNNWWIVKRPQTDSLVVDDVPDVIRHGDIIQLVHGITSRALNSHDVAAPVTPRCQEVSCYIDYEINMKGELLWRVEILNRDSEGPIWHAIKSEVRLIHVSTQAALRFTGQQLPEWGFNQHEIAGDRTIDNKDTIWNVEEHRYSIAHDEREREQQLLKAEMLPTQQTKLTFFQKLVELQMKMMSHRKTTQTHMYSSEPLEWPLLSKGIAYWVDSKSNGQIHLLGNLFIWYAGSGALTLYTILGIFYLIRRQRLYYDIDEAEWQRFISIGHIHYVGYLIHYLPYFFMDRTLFLHHYLPAFLFKVQLLCYVIEHVDYLLRKYCTTTNPTIVSVYRGLVLLWLIAVIMVYIRFLPLSYGFQKLSTSEVLNLLWKDTWDFVLQKDLIL